MPTRCSWGTPQPPRDGVSSRPWGCASVKGLGLNRPVKKLSWVTPVSRLQDREQWRGGESRGGSNRFGLKSSHSLSTLHPRGPPCRGLTAHTPGSRAHSRTLAPGWGVHGRSPCPLSTTGVRDCFLTMATQAHSHAGPQPAQTCPTCPSGTRRDPAAPSAPRLSPPTRAARAPLHLQRPLVP